jgi:hypothetical protein
MKTMQHKQMDGQSNLVGKTKKKKKKKRKEKTKRGRGRKEEKSRGGGKKANGRLS